MARDEVRERRAGENTETHSSKAKARGKVLRLEARGRGQENTEMHSSTAKARGEELSLKARVGGQKKSQKTHGTKAKARGEVYSAKAREGRSSRRIRSKQKYERRLGKRKYKQTAHQQARSLPPTHTN